MEPNEAMVSAVATQTGMSPEDVRVVLAAQTATLAGKPEQTVQRDSASGDVAVRVVRDGIPGWWVVTQSDGSAVWDLNPDKEWAELYTPEKAE